MQRLERATGARPLGQMSGPGLDVTSRLGGARVTSRMPTCGRPPAAGPGSGWWAPWRRVPAGPRRGVPTAAGASFGGSSRLGGGQSSRGEAGEKDSERSAAQGKQPAGRTRTNCRGDSKWEPSSCLQAARPLGKPDPPFDWWAAGKGAGIRRKIWLVIGGRFSPGASLLPIGAKRREAGLGGQQGLNAPRRGKVRGGVVAGV